MGGGDAERQRQQLLLEHCDQHFGLGWLQRWGATARQVCTAPQQLGGAQAIGGGGGLLNSLLPPPSAMTCRSMNDTHMPASSAPHLLCNATNLLLDPGKLVSRSVGLSVGWLVGLTLPPPCRASPCDTRSPARPQPSAQL